MIISIRFFEFIFVYGGLKKYLVGNYMYMYILNCRYCRLKVYDLKYFLVEEFGVK